MSHTLPNTKQGKLTGSFEKFIANLANGCISVQCRMAWSSLETDCQGNGRWHDLVFEESLQMAAARLNEQYAGVIFHWIEYK